MSYLNDAFYADLVVKADFLDVDIDATGIAPDGKTDTNMTSVGGLLDLGYRLDFDGGIFAEPQAAPEGWSGFLRGNYQFANDYDAISGNLGLRYVW